MAQQFTKVRRLRTLVLAFAGALLLSSCPSYSEISRCRTILAGGCAYEAYLDVGSGLGSVTLVDKFGTGVHC